MDESIVRILEYHLFESRKGNTIAARIWADWLGYKHLPIINNIYSHLKTSIAEANARGISIVWMSPLQLQRLECIRAVRSVAVPLLLLVAVVDSQRRRSNSDVMSAERYLPTTSQAVCLRSWCIARHCHYLYPCEWLLNMKLRPIARSVSVCRLRCRIRLQPLHQTQRNISFLWTFIKSRPNEILHYNNILFFFTSSNEDS